MIKCKRCKEEKLESEMVVRAGKPSKVCLECKGNGGKPPKKNRRAAAPEAADSSIKVEAGFGFEADIIEEKLQITQHNAGGEDDNVVLSRTEAKVLFAQFADWVNEP